MIEEVIGRLVIEGAVAAAAVVEAFEVIEDREGGGAASGEGRRAKGWPSVSSSALMEAKALFSKGVVVAIAFGANALAQAGALEQIARDGGRVLATAIGMEDGPADDRAAVQSARDRAGDQLAVQSLGELPAGHAAGGRIDHDSETEPAFGGRDVGNVAHQLNSRCARRSQLCEQIGRRMCAVRMCAVIRRGRFGPKGPARTGAQAVETHEPGGAVFRAGMAARPQLPSHARTAVAMSVTIGVDEPHLLDQPCIGLRPRPGSRAARGVIARA